MKKYARFLLDRSAGWFSRILFDRYFYSFARKADIDSLFVQLSGLLEIRDIIGPGIPLGPLSGWAISPDTLQIILRDVLARNMPRVVEFGAGESTIAIAAALKAAGGGTLITVEHDAKFMQKISARIERYGLQRYASFRLVAMRNYAPSREFSEFLSYDLKDFDIDFDIALVDGPIMAQFGAATRSVPLDWCASRVRGDRVVYMDDAARTTESKIIQVLESKWSALAVQIIGTERGLLKLCCVNGASDSTI